MNELIHLGKVDDGVSELGVQAGLFLDAIPDWFAECF